MSKSSLLTFFYTLVQHEICIAQEKNYNELNYILWKFPSCKPKESPLKLRQQRDINLYQGLDSI